MKKEELENLIKRANKFIGKSIPVKQGKNTKDNKNPFVSHIFNAVGNIFRNKRIILFFR